jgi:lysophospholipase L1-like esterase
MIDCLILGDSIAVGVSKNRPECDVIAKSGITSPNFVKAHITKNLSADTVLVSLGSNDAGVNTLQALTKLRKTIRAKSVYWILPAQFTDARYTVEKIALKNGDTIVRIPDVSADGIHPTSRGYKRLAEITR